MQKMHEPANTQLLQKANDEIVFLRQQISKIEQERDTIRRTLENDKADLRNRLDKADEKVSVSLRLIEDQRKPRRWWP